MQASRSAIWTPRLTWTALVLTLGGLAAALIAAVGSGQGFWSFGEGFSVLRWAFYAAVGGGVIAIVAFVLGRRSGVRSTALNLLALAVALAFGGYLARQVSSASSVPAIHDVATDLNDLPQFTTLKVRDDNLEKIPDQGDARLAALPPLERWKAIHREAYADVRSVRLADSVAQVTQRAQALAQGRRWRVARVDLKAGIVEATATTLFFRFKDDVVVRVRPDALGRGSIVDMRSISRVGGSDVGVNAARIRAFLADLRKA